MGLELADVLVLDPPPFVLVVDSVLYDVDLEVLFQVMTCCSAVLSQIAIIRSVINIVLVAAIPIAHWLLRFAYVEKLAFLAFDCVYNSSGFTMTTTLAFYGQPIFVVDYLIFFTHYSAKLTAFAFFLVLVLFPFSNVISAENIS